jgi:hypothetical protein
MKIVLLNAILAIHSQNKNTEKANNVIFINSSPIKAVYGKFQG